MFFGVAIIDKISMGMSILYFKGHRSIFLNSVIFLSLKIATVSVNQYPEWKGIQWYALTKQNLYKKFVTMSAYSKL